MAKKSKKKAPAKAKPVKAPAKPVPVEVAPPRVSFRPAKPTTRKSSVIMLSSAENSLCSEPSLILNEPSISIIDLARPSTRMSMEMDMTDLSDPRFSTRSPAGDDTDLSLTNIVQTPGVYRERPKSSWVMRRTRSKSMVAAPTVLEDVPEEVEERLSRNRATQSGEFSKVTRRARSVRPPARYLESIDENAVTKRAKNSRMKTVVEQAVESSLPMVTPAKVTTRRRNVAKEKVPEEVPIEPEVTQSSSVSTRRRNKPVQPDENHNHSEKEPEQAATSVFQTTSEEESNKSLETVSMVSVRRRRAIERPPSPEYPPEEPVFTQEPEPVERLPSPEYPPEEPAFTQEPEPVPVVRSRGRQRRAVERISSPEPNPVVAPRPRTRSASRERQPILLQAPESASRPKRATKKVSKCPCCVNGQTHQESTSPAPTTKARGRSRTRSEQPPAAQEKPAPKIRAARSKSVMREPAPKTPPARSKSVSRESLSHVPVYRQQLDAPVEPAAVTAAKKQSADQDVYAFDSPGLLGVDSGSDTGKRKRKGAGSSTTKKKPRLGSSISSRGKRVTPAKKTAIFGTDMHRIGRVVQKIGGGPVKQPTEPMQTVNLDPLPPVSHSRPASPVVSNYDPVDARDDNDQIEQPVIIPPSPPRPQVPPSKVNPFIERVLQQRPLDPAASPDRSQPPNVTLGFSPLGASSPWRVQNENVLPRTFYFSRSKDLLPSYESDVVVRDENVRPKTPVAEPQVSPVKPAAVAPITGAKADAMFRGIQQSYEQLKVTSEMSNKLITAMRKYKTTVHNQSVASISASGELPEDERLIAKFHEYEANMKKTYQKLKQWYERSQQQLTHSIKTIEQVSAVPKTLAQRQVLDNFRRDSKVFLTMINELESAMNDSNVENVSPRKVAPSDKPAFKDVVILTERNLANRNRSPLKTLEIANIPARFSPIKSPLVRSSFSAFAASKNLNKPAVAAPASAIEIADTFAEPSIAPTEEQHPKKDLFGFETDDAEEASDPAPSAATPIKITKKTLKERLESVRKMLPPRPPSRGAFSTASLTRREPRMPKVIEGPSNSKPRSVQSVFASSTPVAKQKRTQTTRRGQLTEQDADLSAIADEPAEQPVAPSPPVALFDDVASTTLSAVNRTYSRIPRRNHKRKRNVYLADLGLSDDDEDEEENEAEQRHHNVDESEPEGDGGAAGKQAKKKRRVAASKKKKNGVEETNEFKQFVNEFNSMCEEVDRYKLVIEKPAGGARQRV
ncbi:titin [Culex quinquefasciatus]|uniref:titin n=1 Tax=Culex quinquefasciatus TaxID=7176 RepID=UPI0018E3C4F7|nr:titin [Culex quinquefasciatus]